MKRYLLGGAAALLFGVVAGLAQQLTSRTLSGSEVILAQVGIGGTGLYIPTGQMRNAQGVVTTALTTGTLSTLTNLNAATLISTAACGGTLTVNLPANPWDGEIFEWSNGTAATAFTTGCVVAATDGATITGGAGANAVTTLAAGSSAEWRYVQSTNTWYRVR